jgi:hypothetical protein
MKTNSKFLSQKPEEHPGLVSDAALTTGANKLIKAGVSMIPAKAKVPTIRWKEHQKQLPKEGQYNYAGGMALVCGFVSGKVRSSTLMPTMTPRAT